MKTPKIQEDNQPIQDKIGHYKYSIPAPKSLRNRSKDSANSSNSGNSVICHKCQLSISPNKNQMQNPMSPETQEERINSRSKKRRERSTERLSSIGKLKEIIRNSRRERSGSPSQVFK